jgi:hypothetical protein
MTLCAGRRRGLRGAMGEDKTSPISCPVSEAYQEGLREPQRQKRHWTRCAVGGGCGGMEKWSGEKGSETRTVLSRVSLGCGYSSVGSGSTPPVGSQIIGG